MTLPDGPRMPAPAQILAWGAQPTGFLERCMRRYGDAFTLRLLGFGGRGFSDVVFLTDPDALKALFTAGPDKLIVGELREPMAPMFGPSSILLLDGAAHMRQRKLLLPPFHGERMAAYGKLIAEATDREIDRWPHDDAFALMPSMQAITLEVILQAVFGLDDAGRRARVGSAIKGALEMVANPLAELLMGLPGKVGPVNIRAPFERKVAEMDAILLAEIAGRRADPALSERDDILSLLLLAHDEDGRGMTDRELRDELVTLLLAGHETTATALAWTFDELFGHPTALDRLHDGDGAYLDAVIQESLRLHPPIAFVDRKLRIDLELAGRTLPAGAIVAPCIYLTHRRPDLYPEPAAFRPERFFDRPPETYGWLPFGGGVRRCVGASFATFEMRVVLETILARTRLRPASSRRERATRRAIVLAPRRGTRAILNARPQPPKNVSSSPTPTPPQDVDRLPHRHAR